MIRKAYRKSIVAVVLICSMCLLAPDIVAFASNAETQENDSTVDDGSTFDDVYTGDDSYYLDDDSSSDVGTGDYYNESGTPYETGSLATAEYLQWENPVIIEKAETNIIVKENNTYDVVKTIKVYYNTETDHKFELTIPRNNFMKSTSDLVENLSVTSSLSNTKYKMSTGTNSFKIVVNDETQGRTYGEYTITYTYVSRGDDASDYDVFMQDLLGFENVPVRKVNFSIIMPKAYTQQNLYFQDIDKNNLNLLASFEGTQITGYYDTLLSGGCLSMTLLVENNYFHSTSISIWIRMLLSAISIICVLCVIGGFALAGMSYYQFGRSAKPEIIPQNKPIKGLTPVDIIVTLSGGTTNEDLLLYLLELANEGYIKVEDTTYKHHKNRNVAKGYYFIKAKDYDGTDKYMKQFMNILFAKSDRVSPYDLSKVTYHKLDKLRLRIQNEGIDELWDIDEARRKLCSNIGLLIPLLTSLLLSLYNIDVGFSIYTFSFLYGPVMSILIYMGIKRIDAHIKKRNMMRGGVADTMTWIYVFGSSFLILLVLGTLNGTMFIKHPLLMTLSYFAEIILIYCSCNMKKRTEEGVTLCGKVLGFRQFLLESDELDIKKAVLKDEQYIYKTLPFAMAMGLATDGWLARMDGCYIDNPTWYKSNSDSEFRLTEFMNDWKIITEAILEKPDTNNEE